MAQFFQTKENFFNLTKKFDFLSLGNIDGIGETQIKSIKNFFSDKINLKIVISLFSIMNIKDILQSKNGKLKNKTFMFTGKLNKFSRAEAKSLTEANAGKILSNVNKKLDYLVIGEKPTNKKIKQAKELKIKVINQSEWEKLLN